MPDQRGETLLSWTFPEYERYERGRAWYVGAFVVGAALLVYAFATKNFLFTVIIVMLAVVLYLRQVQQPAEISFAITERGVLLADRFTPFEGLRDYWFVTEEGAPRVVYFHPRRSRPRFGVPLGDRDPSVVRDALRGRLPENEDEHEEPTTDTIGRALKL